ncbi:MAG: PEP-utilizing enzyme [bacterium]
MSAVTHFGKWRIKPSGKLPIYLRFIINSSFTPEITKKHNIKTTLSNRTYLNHMMYWKAAEYNKFEKEIINHLKNDDGWFEKYCKKEIEKAEEFYKKGLELKKTNWTKKTNKEIKKQLLEIIEIERNFACPWYAQYPLDEYFESAIERELKKYMQETDNDFRKYVLIFTDPSKATEVSMERENLVKLAREFFSKKENLNHLSENAKKKIKRHLDKYAYINSGWATGKAYIEKDITDRIKEIKKQIGSGASIKQMLYDTSEKKVEDGFREALKKIKPDQIFKKLINKARFHSYVRNRRVEAFFNGDYGASFIYNEIARRSNFNEDLIIEVTVPEMIGALEGKKLPSKEEMDRRLNNYAMVVRNCETKLITDPEKIKKLERIYFVDVVGVMEIKGKMACLGGIIKGRAKVCLDKSEIGKIEKGDILVTQFTTPDFVPAMEKAAAIVADQGGLSSHAAIVSRELGVPCVIATKNGTRIIKDNDLLEVNAKTGVVKILERK